MKSVFMVLDGICYLVILSLGSYYTYDVVPPYLVFEEYRGLSTSTFVL